MQPLPSAHSEIASAVKAANAAFYDAFATRDMTAMEQLWAENAPVACVHPGWDILTGREQVIESWRRILKQPSAPDIAHRNAHPMIYGTCVLVSCQELLSGITLAAVNTFVYESNGWRMVMHQASQIGRPTPRHDMPPTGAVH